MRKLIIFLIVLGGLGYAGWFFLHEEPQIESGSTLVLTLEGEYVEDSVSALSQFFGSPQQSLVELLSQLRRAESDSRIARVLLRVRGLEIGWGRAGEIREALRALSEAKETVALLEYEGYGNIEYYVASAADRVIANPAANTPFVGLAAEFLFFGESFEKIGIEFEYERIGRYKSAVESFAGSRMSDANREMQTALLDAIEARFISQIAAARGVEEEQLRAAVAAAPASPRGMREHALVDSVSDYAEVLRDLGNPALVDGETWAQAAPEKESATPPHRIALIYGSGMVVTGESNPRGGQVMASDTLAEALREASQDSEIKAIVLRINSPGGSPLASEMIWRAIRAARAEGKPVIVSMSDLAASGGYYVASAADRIVSRPETLTGSIGVFALRPVLAGLFDKLGVGVDSLTRGEHADLLLLSAPLSPESRAVLRRDVVAIYETFLTRVAEGRGMERDAVDAVGRGRVWTGDQALALGLVDRLGGLREAVALALEQVGVKPDAGVTLVEFPRPRPFLQQLADLAAPPSIEVGLAEAGRAAHLAPLPASLRSLIPGAAHLQPGAPLLLPSAWVEIR